MPLPARSVRPSAAVLIAVLLGGCIFPYPPFWDPTMFPPFGESTIVVQNETDEDWVIVVVGAGPTGFAVPAGSSGTVPLWGGPAVEARLLDVDCEEAAALELGEGTDTPPVLVIGDGGVLSTGSADAVADDLPTLIEYFDCFAGGAPVEPGQAAPDASGTLIVLGEDYGLWAVDPSTAEVTALAPGDPQFLMAGHALSPDGSRVAYTSWDAEMISPTIVVASLDGSDPLEVAEDGDMPVWSPDGTRLAYLDLDPFAGGSALTVVDVDADGGTPRTLAPLAAWMAWSPDGTRIAFVADATHDVTTELPEAGTLFVVDVASGEVTELGETAPFASTPAWSPDGTRIAFSGGSFDTSDVRVIDAGGGEATVVAGDPGRSYAEPAWSPDGARLAVTSFAIGFLSSSSSVSIVPASGDGEIQDVITSPSDTYYRPTWSPDGAWLAFARSDQALSGSLVLVDPESSDEVVVAEHVFGVAGWRP